MEHELDKLYDEWYEVILEVPVLMNQPTEKSTFLLNDVSMVKIFIDSSQWAKKTEDVLFCLSLSSIFSTFSTICCEGEKLRLHLLVLKHGYSHTGLQASHVSMSSMSCAKWNTQFGLALDSRILS